MTTLTASELETSRRQAISKMQKRLDKIRPNPAHYQTSTSKAAVTVAATMAWSRAALPLIALLASLASAIRTVSAVYEIYNVTTAWTVAAFAAVFFALAADGTVFALGLAQEHEKLKAIAAGRKRRVTSLKSIGRSVLVRVGYSEPVPYEDLDHNLGLPTMIAFAFILTTNMYVGMQPLIREIGATNLQDFLATLPSAPARIQMMFFVDIAGVLFPPLMALVAGHQTARFAAEIAAAATIETSAYERDMIAWRESYNDPLDTEEGQEVLQDILNEKLRKKQQKARPIQEGETIPFETINFEEDYEDPFVAASRQNGGAERARSK